MKIMEWLREKFRKAPPDRASVAFAMADDVLLHTRSLREQIEPFREDNDPFTAIGRAKSISQGEYPE